MAERFRARKTKNYYRLTPVDVWVVEHERLEWKQVAECEDEGKAEEMVRLLNAKAEKFDYPDEASVAARKWWAIWTKSGS